MYSLLLHRCARQAISRLPHFSKCLGVLILTYPILGDSAALTERQSLEFGLNRPDYLELLASQLETVNGDLTRADTWANPELEFSREEVGGETETDIFLRQRLDFSSRRALNRDAAQSALNAMQAEMKTSRMHRAALIRQQFYQSLYYQQLQQLLDHWVEKFTAVESAMFRRERSGDVSGYDRRRISREKVSLLAQQRESKASYEAAWLQLRGSLGIDDAQGFDVVQGELIPNELPTITDLSNHLKSLPSLLQLQHQTEEKRLASRALALGYFPELTLGVGQKRLEGHGVSDTGLMLSAAISLPIFDRQQGEYQRAIAEARQIESEYRLALSRIEAEAHSLWQLAEQLTENARLFQQQSVSASYELLQIAETAYHNNELGVLELIDAYRNALESEVTALQLALEARMKRIELNKLIEGDSL